MSNGYVVGGLWFFGTAIGLGIAIVLVGPLPGIRQVGLIGLVSAISGYVLHLNGLRTTDPSAYAALVGRSSRRFTRRSITRSRSAQPARE